MSTVSTRNILKVLRPYDLSVIREFLLIRLKRSDDQIQIYVE
jgi:hypothetical protein